MQALSSNTTGSNNTASGYQALNFNTNGALNTATGVQALNDNINGNFNTATGYAALSHNIQGGTNTATGVQALNNNTTGSNNTATGYQAGSTSRATAMSFYRCLGAAGVNDTTWIRNVYASVASGRAVYVNSDNKIGTLFLITDVTRMRSARWRRPARRSSRSGRSASATRRRLIRRARSLLAIIAEEVAEVDPDLVTPDRDGKPETVRYEAVNAMLLNEFLKEHRKNEEQEATIAQLKQELQATAAHQQKQIEALTTGFQKVSAQLAAASLSVADLKRANSPQDESAVVDLRRKWSSTISKSLRFP